MSKDILHDYREDVLGQGTERWREHKIDLLKQTKKEWDSAKNILAKTLVYEVSPVCKDVEGYSFVCKDSFREYCDNYEKKYSTADIMNGWWYCFKIFFPDVLSGRRQSDATRKNMKKLIVKIGDKKDKDVIGVIKEDYPCSNENDIKMFLSFLRVVYTIGNMTPAPINPPIGGGSDMWEYKLKKYRKMYHDYKGDIDTLFFQDYDLKKIVWTTDQIKNDPAGYFGSRIDLIIRRGYRIKNNFQGPFSQAQEEECKKIKESVLI